MNEVFVDTSIQIARFIHSPGSKDFIEKRLSCFESTVSSLVVKQEFKRRLLKEAKYLLDLIAKYGRFSEVHRHVVDVLGPHHSRKRNICLEMFSVLFETQDEEDLIERLKLSLRTLLLSGLDNFDAGISKLVESSNCKCATLPITEKKPFVKYEFGSDRCSKVEGCGIREFLNANRENLELIFSYLKSLETQHKTPELERTEGFIESFLVTPDNVQNNNPCLSVGDLLIALESYGMTSFYTMNAKESQHFCRILKQDMIVRPKHPEKEDTICQSGQDWSSFS